MSAHRNRIEGVLQQVGPSDHEVQVRVGDRVVGFDVPPECPVMLLGERVKLQLLQPRDLLEVTYSDDHSVHVASYIRALWQLPGTNNTY